ncbi:unnamed protein product, partial [Rotaria magnacalcarata]
TNKQQIQASSELKKNISDDNTVQMPSRIQRSVIETTISPVSNESNAAKPQVFSTTAEIVREMICVSLAR